MFEEMMAAKMYNLNETIAKDIFEGVTYHGKYFRKTKFHCKTGRHFRQTSMIK